MVSKSRIAPHTILPKPRMGEEWGVSRASVKLNRGRVSDVLRVFDGPCVITSMFMEITEAVPSGTNNMSWVFRSDTGGYRTIGDAVDIAASALGDFYWAELDGSAIVQATTSTGLIHGGYDRKVTGALGGGTIVTPGGIDIKLSDATLATGRGTLYLTYRPLMPGASIVAEDLHSSTTTSSTTTTSSSSSSSSSSTTSTTSSTSSTASTTSTTSSTSSTASTTSTTSSTSSTASTTSTSSSTTSTSTSTSTTTTAP